MSSRVIRDEIRTSEGLARVSIAAELTFDRLLIAADEFGRLDARPALLKAALFPCRLDAEPEQIVGWVAELVDEDAARVYQGERYGVLQVTNWERYRAKRNRPAKSKLAAPDGSFGAWSPDESPQSSAEICGEPNGSADRGEGVKGSRGQGERVPLSSAEDGAREPAAPSGPRRLASLGGEGSGDEQSGAEPPARAAEPGSAPPDHPQGARSEAGSPYGLGDSAPGRAVDSSEELLDRVWARGLRALDQYGHPSRERLTDKRRARLRAILAKGQVGERETALAQAVHGYVARCGLEKRDGYDPLQGFKLARIVDEDRFDENFEAAADALDRGHHVPFKKGDNTGRPRRPQIVPVRGGDPGALVAGLARQLGGEEGR